MEQLAKIYRHCYKERLQISRLAEFESDMSETSEDTALQSRKIYSTNLPLLYKHQQNFVALWSHKFVSIHPITLKLGNFTDFKAFFPALLVDFR